MKDKPPERKSSFSFAVSKQQQRNVIGSDISNKSTETNSLFHTDGQHSSAIR